MLNSSFAPPSFAPWPTFSDEELASVERVLLSGKVNYWTGTEGREFEREFASYCGTQHAVALSNGTVALEVILRCFGIGEGDEVIVTPRTFIASASAIAIVGAKPIFADVDAISQNITAATVQPVLTPNTKAIIAVHLAGWPCDMDPLMSLAQDHNLKVIEDCAQAHGATYRGIPVGGIGHAAAWSFCQDKIISTGGEGGMVTTNDSTLWGKIWSYKDHGKSWSAVHERQHPPGFKWLHESVGTNLRMTEMQAAIGRIQLGKLPHWNLTRRENACRINETTRPFGIVRNIVWPDEIQHACYKHYVILNPERLKAGWNQNRIIQEISARGIPCFQGSCAEIYLEKCFEFKNLSPQTHLPVAKILGETTLMFLVHPTLTKADIANTCSVIEEVFALCSLPEDLTIQNYQRNCPAIPATLRGAYASK
ncbi:MAG: DegT/DnrJ/EryC1/StrS aminotransferase family protein [Pseudomonadales bacterium]